MKLFDYEYLSSEALSGFDNYKYSSIDLSPVGKYITHPFWNFVVQFCPKWVAPNVLTFSGFLLTVLNFFLLAYYDPTFYASSEIKENDIPEVPKWVFMLSAINLFVAHTLDGIDGKQARRTGTSGPLGELFDHGLDSWSAAFIPIVLYSAFSCGYLSTLRMYFVIWNVFFNFYTAHWEKYNTGVLFLPLGYDAAMLGMVVLLGLTGIYGHQMWHFSLWPGFTSSHLFEVIFYVTSLGSNFPLVLYNIYKSYRDRTGYMRTFSEAVRPLVSVTTLFAVSTAWAVYSPNGLIYKDARWFYVMCGTIFSNICCRLIVAQMSSQQCELFNWLLLPISMCAVTSLWVPVGSLATERALLYSLTVFSIAVHIHYGSCVEQSVEGCRDSWNKARPTRVNSMDTAESSKFVRVVTTKLYRRLDRGCVF